MDNKYTDRLWLSPHSNEDFPLIGDKDFFLINCCKNFYTHKNQVVERTRKDWSFCIILSGGLSMPDDQKVSLKNTLYIFPPNKPQRITYRTSCYTYWLHIKGAKVDYIMQNLRLPYNKPLPFLDIKASSILNEIFTEYTSKNTNYEEISLLLTEKFLYNLPREIIDYNQADETVALNNLIDHLHLNPKLSNDECAKLCYMTTDVFVRLFKKHFQITPHKFKQQLIVSKAKDLLENTNYSITDIALILGFENNPLYFSNFFKLHTGKYPSEFRKEKNEPSNNKNNIF